MALRFSDSFSYITTCKFWTCSSR